MGWRGVQHYHLVRRPSQKMQAFISRLIHHPQCLLQRKGSKSQGPLWSWGPAQDQTALQEQQQSQGDAKAPKCCCTCTRTHAIALPLHNLQQR